MCTDNKNVLIVGGSGKIGSSIASRMISKGYRVFIAARDEQKLLEVQSMLGEKCHPLVLDVSKSDKDTLVLCSGVLCSCAICITPFLH